jgi:hypothetical protein
MDWFEELTGFPERDYAGTQALLKTDGDCLVSIRSGRRSAMGRLELLSLRTLRERVASLRPPDGPPTPNRLQSITGDVRRLHRHPDYAGALFQVASQFNLLEMLGPEVSPEEGVTRYAYDKTQGPACAMAAGAATIYRNYLVPVGGGIGQTATRQLDALTDLRAALSSALGRAPSALWTMQNGYTRFEPDALEAVSTHLRSLDESDLDRLRATSCIGLHWDVEVTDIEPGPLVSQAFCSALPLGGYAFESKHWEPLARLVLEAAYEATLLAGVLNAHRGTSNTVLLTRVGGNAFSNPHQWIEAAMHRAIDRVRDCGLRIVEVKYGRD